MLMFGAAGGVGSLALQIAVAQGVQVIAVARSHHHGLLSALGAVACLDYTTQDVVAEAPVIAGRKLDTLVDFVGGETVARSLPAIRSYGRVASIAGLSGDLEHLLDLNLTLHGLVVRPERTRLLALDALIASGQLHPIIDQVLPLEEAAQAHRRLEANEATSTDTVSPCAIRGSFGFDRVYLSFSDSIKSGEAHPTTLALEQQSIKGVSAR